MMYNVDCFLNKYYIFDAEVVYVVDMVSTIGKMVDKDVINGKIEKNKWNRLYKLEENNIDVISIDDYKKYLGEIKKNIILKEDAVKRVRKANKRNVNRKKAKVIKEEEMFKSKRINRKKKEQNNKEIINRLKILAFAAVLGASGASIGSSLLNKAKSIDNGYGIEKSIDNKNDDNKLIVEPCNNDEDKLKNKIQDKNDDNNFVDADDTLTFCFDEYQISEESAKNAMQYRDLCKKYGDMYGEDYRILMGILAQELNGDHKLQLDTPAVGVAQLEKKDWVNENVSEYNMIEGKFDNYWFIAPNVEDNISDEEFNKRPKSGDIIEKNGIESVLNIEKAEGSIHARAMVDARNYRSAYKNGALKKIPENNLQAYSIARGNMGPIVYKTLDYGEDWKEHLDIIEHGDVNYYRSIYSYANYFSDVYNDKSPFKTRIYDGEKIIEFSVRAIATRQIAKTK